jgi:hypothetical protein
MIPKEHILRSVDGKYLCKFGAPIGTLGRVLQEFAKVTMTFAAVLGVRVLPSPLGRPFEQYTIELYMKIE